VGASPLPAATAANELPDPLPQLTPEVVGEALQRLTPQDLSSVLKNRVLPVAWLPGMVVYAACGDYGKAHARQNHLKIAAEIDPQVFLDVVRSVCGARLLAKAVEELHVRRPSLSARRRLSPAQIFAAVILAGALVEQAIILPLPVSWLLLSITFSLFFLSVISLKLLCLLPAPRSRRPKVTPLADDSLPVYTVLVPVFREIAVLDQLIRALKNLNYPADKLDIKIITEERDFSMRRALAKCALPPQFEIIVVPAGKPQTKPRALNYALQFARGTLLTIYDAEDTPELMQLRNCAARFHGADASLACIQARLTFFNANENWLTRQFAAEYGVLFGGILPALANLNMPLPLGGTSNHFRTRILHEVGAWDPYNVTEDADLGFRLARFGYTTSTSASHTYEEANTQLINWVRQRARWLKGFLHTWVVHMRHPSATAQELGVLGFWVLQTMTAGVFFSALLHPLLLSATVWLFIRELYHPTLVGLSATLFAGLNLVVFVLGYVVSMVASAQALRRHGLPRWYLTVAAVPVYWLLMFVAAWLALWQFLVEPHKWNKTEHGLSKLVEPEASAPRHRQPRRKASALTAQAAE
jgi:cellulose synthase/poly-beta-1,6-N-acetylglucosamine synthase-like glycosyltransferase